MSIKDIWGIVGKGTTYIIQLAIPEVGGGSKRQRAQQAASKSGDGPRRGPHAASSVGGSMGGGQMYPQNLHHTVVNLAIFAGLFGLDCFQRLAKWTNVLFMGFNPGVHKYYEQTLDRLFTWDAAQQRPKHLIRNFLRGTSATSHGVGAPSPRSAPFNPNLGGHLVLWDLRLIIRFPPGATIFIPLAILRHSNVKIRANERRYSFTQFTPAGIFRWVYNGFRTDKDIENSTLTTDELRERWRADRARRWEEGVLMYRIWKHKAKK
ncbi:hypothetical protein DFH07DRAFT_969868 [Mycena maculata]|uniref:Uncharacterized protein n=1 Tax=Mycena maculata TaxID=230809 RepID=A0AAD7HUC4_9AGAR|nr:hypothetical protein DFH07DRAFT_969868 [Mycena maculata]